MRSASTGVGLALSVSAAAFGIVGLVPDGRRPRAIGVLARSLALFALALAAALAGAGWLLPLALFLLALADGVLAFAVVGGARLLLAEALLLLAIAAEAALAARAGGGAGLLRAEPLRLAGAVAALSLGVLGARRGPLRPAAAGPQGVVVILALFVLALAALALPLSRGAAMAGALLMLFALTPLGTQEGRPWAGRAPLVAFSLGQALFALGFIAPLALPR